MLKNITPGFACNGLRKQRLAGPRRPHKENPSGNAASKALRFLRIFQELDDFLKLTFGFINSGHIIEAYLHILLAVDLSLVLCPGTAHPEDLRSSV